MRTILGNPVPAGRGFYNNRLSVGSCLLVDLDRSEGLGVGEFEPGQKVVIVHVRVTFSGEAQRQKKVLPGEVEVQDLIEPDGIQIGRVLRGLAFRSLDGQLPWGALDQEVSSI